MFWVIFYVFDTLSYLFDHIWTNLLTQYTQWQFLSPDVCELQVFTIFTVVQKFKQKYIQNQRDGSFQSPEGGPEGGHPRLGGQGARPHPRPRQEGAWMEGPPPGAPLWPIFTPQIRNPREALLFANFSFVSSLWRFQDRDSLANLSWYPAGRRIDLLKLLHHYERLSDVS